VSAQLHQVRVLAVRDGGPRSRLAELCRAHGSGAFGPHYSPEGGPIYRPMNIAIVIEHRAHVSPKSTSARKKRAAKRV
jgi:hypothetical protein